MILGDISVFIKKMIYVGELYIELLYVLCYHPCPVFLLFAVLLSLSSLHL